jgi:hypothetical protein
MSAVSMFGTLVLPEAQVFQDCYKAILYEFCDKYETRYTSPYKGILIDILPIFFRLFSTGFPFILWCEFIHMARKHLVDLETEQNSRVKSTIWRTLQRIAQIQTNVSERMADLSFGMDDPQTSSQRNHVRCGVRNQISLEAWSHDMQAQLTNCDQYFTWHEIHEMIMLLQRSFGNCVLERMESGPKTEDGEEDDESKMNRE